MVGAETRIGRYNEIVLEGKDGASGTIEDEGVEWGSDENDSEEEEGEEMDDKIVKPTEHILGTFAAGRLRTKG